MHKFLTLATVIAVAQFAAYGELTVSVQKKSQIPSDKNVVIGLNGVDTVNAAIADVEQTKLGLTALSGVVTGLSTSVYTKAQTDAAITESRNGTVQLGGTQTITGVKTFTDGVRFTTFTNSTTGAAVTAQIRGNELAFWSGVNPPADTTLITRVKWPTTSGKLITDNDIKTLLEILLNPLDGRRVNMGNGSFQESKTPNDNANGIAFIYFTTDSIGANDGDYLTSFTFRTRTSGYLEPQNICLAFFDKADSTRLQLSYTEMHNVTAVNTDYKFTLVDPMLMSSDKTYAILFRLGQGVDNPNCPLGLALNNSQAVNDIFVGTSNADRQDLRPICKATWYTPATKRAVQAMIDKSR